MPGTYFAERTYSSDEEEPSPINLVRTNYNNRRAASRLRERLRQTAPNIARDEGYLPDVGVIDLNSTPAPSKKSSDEMSKPVLFSGKPSQLEPCITYAKVKCIADGTSTDEQRAGTVASLLRGAALTWLTKELAKNSEFLADYEEFCAQLRKAFGTTDHAQKLKAARQLAGLRQKGSVQDYARKFEDLAEQAGINAETKLALFQNGLKPKLREGLIIGTDEDEYDSFRDEAVRIDEELYYASPQGQGSRRSGKDSKYGKRGSDGKFVKKEY